MDTITFFGNTDVGQIRSNNEDAFIARYIWDENHILAVAIDGLGGYEGGEVAASLAQKCIVKYLESYPNGERLELLKQAVISANNTIFSERKEHPEYSDMGCVLTATLIEVENKRINMAHIGDTRLYQYVDGFLVKLSHDHSYVGYREEKGELTEEEAMRHPERSSLDRDMGSRFLESSGNNYVELATFPLNPNSILLLCSDGLCDMITSEQMKIELEKDITVQDKVANLIKEANNAGGLDNVTVVIVEFNAPLTPIVEKIEEEKSQETEQETSQEEAIEEPEMEKEDVLVDDVNETVEEKKQKTSIAKILMVLFFSVMLIAIGYIWGVYDTSDKVLKEKKLNEVKGLDTINGSPIDTTNMTMLNNATEYSDVNKEISNDSII